MYIGKRIWTSDFEDDRHILTLRTNEYILTVDNVKVDVNLETGERIFTLTKGFVVSSLRILKEEATRCLIIK